MEQVFGMTCKIKSWRIASSACPEFLKRQEAQLSLTNRVIPICEVVEVLQDFLSEYVDKKFTRDHNVILFLSSLIVSELYDAEINA